MRASPVGRLSEAQPEALDQEQEDVQESARKRDVVVDEQQPVVPLRGRSIKQGIEILELAPAAGLGALEADAVLGAQQLVTSTRHQVWLPGALYSEREHAALGPASRRPLQPPALGARKRPSVRDRVGDERSARGPDTVDQPTGSGEEV